MATAQTIIDRAARLVAAVNSGSSCTAEESADGLIALNAMLESWQIDKLNVYSLTDTAFPLIAGTSSYTVGPAGNFALTPRPTTIEYCFVRVSNSDTPVDIVSAEEWFAIPDKTEVSSYPTKAYYEPTLSTGTLLVYPVPNVVNSLHIVTWQSVSTIPSLATTIAFPSGYERAMAYNLAVEWAGPEFGLPISNDVRKVAQEALGSIKRANHRSIVNRSPMAEAFMSANENILTGS